VGSNLAVAFVMAEVLIVEGISVNALEETSY
jgi:hypothetical protein